MVTSDSTYPWMKGQVAAGVKSTDLGVYTYENMNFGLCRILIPVMNGNIQAGHSFPPATQDSDWDYATIQAYAAYVAANVFQPAGVSGPTLTHPAPDALAYTFPTGSGWNSGDLSTFAGGAGWHMSVGQLLDVMGAFRRGGVIMPVAAAQAMLGNGFGIDLTANTPQGKLYNKNGRWGDGANHTEQTLAYFLPADMELVVFANSPVGAADTFFRDLVTNIYMASIGGEIGMGGWVAHHNMTGEQYQETFNNLVINEGMQLVDVSGYGATGNLYAALWVRNANPPAWEARHGMTSQQYQETFNQLTGQGYSPVLVDGYDAGGQAHFAAIFQKGVAGAFLARHGMTSAEYQQAFDANGAQGFYAGVGERVQRRRGGTLCGDLAEGGGTGGLAGAARDDGSAVSGHLQPDGEGWVQAGFGVRVWGWRSTFVCGDLEEGGECSGVGGSPCDVGGGVSADVQPTGGARDIGCNW